jgi:hypothetical protein
MLITYQTKAFCKFLPVIVVIYMGFLTTFTMLARDRMTLNEMSWLLIKVFFGCVRNHDLVGSQLTSNAGRVISASTWLLRYALSRQNEVAPIDLAAPDFAAIWIYIDVCIHCHL